VIITTIVPEENSGFCGDITLIVLDKMESELQRYGKSRQRRPSYLAEPSNVTAMNEKICAPYVLSIKRDLPGFVWVVFHPLSIFLHIPFAA
jgi:hypothetical protein